jgi:hypothetical protein
MNPISAGDVFLTVAIMSTTFLIEVGFFILVGSSERTLLWGASNAIG